MEDKGPTPAWDTNELRNSDDVTERKSRLPPASTTVMALGAAAGAAALLAVLLTVGDYIST